MLNGGVKFHFNLIKATSPPSPYQIHIQKIMDDNLESSRWYYCLFKTMKNTEKNMQIYLKNIYILAND